MLERCEQHAVLEDVGVIAGMEDVTIGEHGLNPDYPSWKR
jgi:hypothetical protein